MPAIRPKVAELAFQLYGRSLHPELFETVQTRTIERSNFQATIQITSTGHLIRWRRGDASLTEVATAAHHPLPDSYRLITHRLRGEKKDSIRTDCGCRYDFHFQLESIAPEVFFSFQQNLAKTENRKGLFHAFGSSGRVAMGAISYIYVESREKSLLVQALHTFPDDSAVVKSESRFLLD